jgi:FlaA1/EpsC-like NDP-sugar epimerase
MTPRPLLLVGAGGLAREVLAAVRLQPSEWKPIGALDDPSKHGADLDGVPVLGGSEVAGELTDGGGVHGARTSPDGPTLLRAAARPAR